MATSKEQAEYLNALSKPNGAEHLSPEGKAALKQVSNLVAKLNGAKQAAARALDQLEAAKREELRLNGAIEALGDFLYATRPAPEAPGELAAPAPEAPLVD